MPDRTMTEAEAVARFSRELDEISARGRAPNSAELLAEIIAENERECAALRAESLEPAKERRPGR